MHRKLDKLQIIDTITPRDQRGTATKSSYPKLNAEPVWNPTTHPPVVAGSVGLLDQTRGARHQNAEPAGSQGSRSRRRRPNRPRTAIRHHPKRFPHSRRGFPAAARHLVDLKGYVTTIDAALMPATEVIASYHDLWRVEQSFRMSKSDLAARPMLARTRDAAEAYLTIVFTTLAVSREVQTRTGLFVCCLLTPMNFAHGLADLEGGNRAEYRRSVGRADDSAPSMVTRQLPSATRTPTNRWTPK